MTEKQIEKDMQYLWDRLNETEDLWNFAQELLNIIEAEKREKLWLGK